MGKPLASKLEGLKGRIPRVLDALRHAQATRGAHVTLAWGSHTVFGGLPNGRELTKFRLGSRESLVLRLFCPPTPGARASGPLQRRPFAGARASRPSKSRAHPRASSSRRAPSISLTAWLLRFFARLPRGPPGMRRLSPVTFPRHLPHLAAPPGAARIKKCCNIP